MMSGRFWKAAGAACAGLIVSGALALAKPVTVVPGDQPITAEIPSSWVSSEIKRGVEIKTADDEVFIWVESYIPAQFDKILAEHNAYLKEQGVTITGEPEQKTKEYDTYALKVSTYPAKDEDGPTVLRYISISPKDEAKRKILLCYWASPDGDKDYDADVNKILDSLKTSIEAQK